MYKHAYVYTVWKLVIVCTVKCTGEFYWPFVHTPTEMTVDLPYSDHCVMVYNHCYFMYKCMIVSTHTHICTTKEHHCQCSCPQGAIYVSVTCALCTCLLANPSNALVCVCVHTYIHISDQALPPCPPAGQGTHNSLPWRTQVRSDPLHLQEAVRWVQSNNIVEAHCYIVTTGE